MKTQDDMDNAHNRLLCFWNNYTSCEPGTNEKTVWFDAFLAEFLISYKKSKIIPEKLSTNVAGVIAQEFILEVHNACTKSDEKDELEPLKNYLLRGRGWSCLAVLQQLSVLKVSTAYELSHLLISLFALVDYEECLNCTGTNPYVTDIEHKNIDVIIREKLNVIRQKSRNFQRHDTSKWNYEFNITKTVTLAENVKSTEVVESSKNGSSDSVKLLTFPRFIFSKNKPKGVTSSIISCHHDESKEILTFDNLQNDAVSEVFSHEVNKAEFRLLIVNILQRFCAEDYIIADEYDGLIGTVIKFALDNLCSLQYRFSKQNDATIAKFKRNLTYLLITCAEGAKRCKKVIESLTQNGIVQIFLQLLQEVTSPSLVEENNSDFLYCLSYCILLLFFQILSQDTITKHLTSFNKLYRQFIGCAGGRLFESVIKTFLCSSSSDRVSCVNRLKIIVTFLGLLIVRFKVLRRRGSIFDESCGSPAVGEETKYSNEVNLSSHHDHLLGKPFKSVILSPAALHENCCISSTFVVLLKIALENFDEELTVTVYKILLYCGTCCCVPVQWFLSKLLKSLHHQKPHVKHLILIFLERKFYHNVGMFKNEICNTCTMTSKCEDSWHCLDEYKALLLDENPQIVRLTGNHLLKVFGNFAYDVQQYMVLQVLHTIFQVAEKEYATSNGSSHKDCILICLAVFSDISVHRMFSVELDELLTTKTIRYLLPDRNFTELCCRVLETRIIHKTSQLDHGAGTFMPVLTDSCTAELNVLLTIFNESYDQIMKMICLRDDASGEAELSESQTAGNAALFQLRIISCTLERLTVRSSVIKSYLHSHSVKNKFQKLLFLVLRILSQDDSLLKIDPLNVDVDDVRLKLTQPLLIICLCLFDDVDMIENRVKDLLHEALQAGRISIRQVCESLLSLEQVENVHRENIENCNSTANTANLIFNDTADNLEQNCDNYDDVIPWSQVETAMSETSDDDGNQLVSLLESYSKSSLLYPMVCTIAIDLINALQVDQCTEEALYVLQHISTICQRNSDICVQLINQNMVGKLLDKLEDSLREDLLTPEETDVQYAITQFLSILFYHRFERNELTRFLNFLKINSAPYDHLISTLAAVVEKSLHVVQPSYYLKFPSTGAEQNDIEFDEPAEALAISMRDMQKRTTAISPWVVCSLTLPLNTNLDWCIWLTGFSTSFWLKYDSAGVDVRADDDFENTATNFIEGAIHVISIGYDSMLLEVWIDERSSCFTARLTRPEGNSFEILSQVSFQKPLDDVVWHNIVLNVKDTMRQQKIALEISLTMDGLYEETKYLIFLGIFLRKVRPACIMLGDSRTSLRSGYSLGNLMMFRAAILSKDCCLTICAFGPNFENVVSCSANTLQPNFTHLLRIENQRIPQQFNISHLAANFDENMKQMQDNILITYTPRKLDNFFHYSNTDSNNGVASLFPPSTPTLFRRSKMPRNNQRVPHAVKALLFSALEVENRKTFFDCVQELGGFQFLAFLFAKLMDCCQAESTQCDSLKLIMTSCFSDIRLYSQFKIYNGYYLISKVIVSPRSRISRTAFIELTNSMCNKRNYFLLTENEMHTKKDVFICNAEILTNMLLPNWKFWESCDPDLLVKLFRGLQSLVTNTNNYRQMNIDHLIDVDVLERTLDMCKEKFVFEDTCCRNNDLCSSILEFIKTMVGSPPSTSHIKSIIDYLYVVHPTSHSFCTHSPSGFYFLFSSLSQHKHKRENSETNSVIENPLLADEELKEKLQLQSGCPKLNRNSSSSLEELDGEKRPAANDFIASDESLKFDDDELKDRATDSGIRSMSTIESSSEPYSYGSNPCLSSTGKNENTANDTIETDSNDIYKYSTLNLPNTSDKLLEKHLEGNVKDDCDQYIITIGLLNIVHDTILVLPDTSVTSILHRVIDSELFLIMANHPNASVRNTVVKILLAWLIRCEDEAALKFVSHNKGFYHLANQLAMYPATEQLVNSCISLMSRCHWDAIDQISEMEEISLPSLHFSALPPLLAIFPGTVRDMNLALNVIHFFKILINKVSQALKKLVEHGLIESLVKTILILIHDEAAVVENNNLLLNEIIDLFALIMSTCIQTPGVLYLQMLNEIVYKCRYLEVTEEALCGPEKECVQIIHNLHCTVLQAGLDTVLSSIDIYHSQDNIKGRRSPSFLTSMTGSMSASLSSIPSSIMSFTTSNVKQKQLPRGEMIDRYKLIIKRATEYLQFSSSSVVTEKDIKFACHLFLTLTNGVSNIVQNKPYIRIGSPWSSIYWSARETLRTQASNLLIWMLAPIRPVHLRMYVIDTLLNEPKTREIITTLIFINVETEQRFTIFLWHLMYSKSSDLSEAEMEVCEEFKAALQEWEIISPQAIGQAHDRWQFEVASALRELSVVYWSLEKAQQDAVYKCVYKMENLSKKLSESAASISASVVERQGKERKKLLNSMKNKYRLHVEGRNRWRYIVQQMTHERAPWYHPEMYPNSWELDPTEGPAGVRKRLRRCKLNIKTKFFKPHYDLKSEPKDDFPLTYLFENADVQGLYTAALDSLSMDDTISYMCFATIVQVSGEVDGELLIGEKDLYFIATRFGDKNVTVNEANKYSLIVKFKDIKEIHNRRFQLEERAVELFLLNGKTSFIAFNTPSDRDKCISSLSKRSLPNRIVNDVMVVDAVEKWRERQITNWEYVKSLNKISGRSYNDLMQYPVMPFILSDYTSECIDLRHENIYRNLKKPMAVQDKKKEIHFINHYNYLKNESIPSPLNTISLKQKPYHYASHYSNSGTVLHFLLRLPPYTQIFLEYQDNNFDLPDRTFHSLDTTWRLTSSESTTDVKELIPEFFYLPEFLLNLQGFNFGVRQNGEVVDNVKLPAWTNGDPRLFVLVHRQMLESEYVRENLPHWIDLVFGYKQTGKAAVDAINVFHPATYCGFEVDSIPDPLERAAWETMVKTYGQTPRLLFRNPHPMVVQNLISSEDDNIPVIKGVKGLKWGNYVGSPSKPSPSIVWNSFHSHPVASLVPLITNDVFGLPKHASLLLSYNKERTINLVNEGVTLMGAALLSWGHSDGIIRIKERKEQPPLPAIFCSPQDPITVCSTAPDCSLIWIGLMSGNILVFRFSFNLENSGVEIESEPVSLVGHSAKVNNIAISKSFGVAVSTSNDQHAIIWDLNEMIYVQSIPSSNLPLSLVEVSDTLGDIATVCNDKDSNSSILRLHTINATLVSSVKLKEKITALCFSRAPEGISVNAIATGFSDGVIRLWSTWDLSPLIDIINTSINDAIIGLTYSYDSQHLYASVSDGNVYIWEAALSSGTTKTPKFLNLTAIN